MNLIYCTHFLFFLSIHYWPSFRDCDRCILVLNHLECLRAMISHQGLDTKSRRGQKRCPSPVSHLIRNSLGSLTKPITLGIGDQAVSFLFLVLGNSGSYDNAKNRLRVKFLQLWLCLNSSVIAYWLQLELVLWFECACWNSSRFPWQ